ncbi:hypothetical protein PO909_026755 [Leuciscus waleckii]
MEVGRFLSTPADRLIHCFQDGLPIEDYVAGFPEISNGVSWIDEVLKIVFWGGLDDSLYQQAPAASIPGTFVQYLDHVLWLSGSNFTVGEVEDIATQPPSPAISTTPTIKPAIGSVYGRPGLVSCPSEELASMLHTKSAQPNPFILPARQSQSQSRALQSQSPSPSPSQSPARQSQSPAHQSQSQSPARQSQSQSPARQSQSQSPARQSQSQSPAR